MAHLNRVALSIAVAALVPAALGHHGSNISYQLEKMITLTGTVTEWAMINPHPQIYFDIKDEQGNVAHWAAEVLPTPSMMKNMNVGWSRTTMKPGDQIVLGCNPSKTAGAKACLAKTLTINGKSWPINVGPGAPPAAKGTKE